MSSHGSQPRPSARTMSAEETRALQVVRRRTTAICFFVVAIHGVIGLVVVADVARPVFSWPWVLVSLVPSAAGLVWVL